MRQEEGLGARQYTARYSYSAYISNSNPCSRCCAMDCVVGGARFTTNEYCEIWVNTSSSRAVKPYFDNLRAQNPDT